MALRATDLLVRHVYQLAQAQRDDLLPDRELLRRFAAEHDQDAFAALVRRYGPMVLRVCRRVLRHQQDAEDCFQATFLVLARKADSTHWQKSIGGWLYRVASRLALESRAAFLRRRACESRAEVGQAADPAAEVSLRDAQRVLDEELARLPERLRLPVVLCCLEGQTGEQAARQLGWPLRTLNRRLGEARELLRLRLLRRGVSLSTALLIAGLGEGMATAEMSALLVGPTVQAAVLFAAGQGIVGASVSSKAAILAEGVIKTLLVAKMKVVTVLLGVMLCLAGGGALAYQALAGNAEEPPQLAGEPKEEAEASRQPGAATRVDCFGDPLPAGALARMGTTRLYYGGDRAEPKALAFSSDGKTLATHIKGMTVCLWDAATGKEIHRLTTEAVKRNRGDWHPQIVSLGFSPDRKTLVAMDNNQAVYWWEVATGKLLRKQEYQGPKRNNVASLSVAFLPDGKMLGFADFLKSVEKGEEVRGSYVWDVATGKEICQLSEPKKKRKNLFTVRAFSLDGKLLATTLEARSIKEKDREKTVIPISLWDVATGKEARQLTYEGDYVNAVAFSTDGKTLASGDLKKICVWEVATGKKIHLLQGEARLLTYSPDGKTLVAGGAGHLWDVGTGKEIRSFGCKGARVALFSPDGEVLAMGDQGGSIRLWQVATGKEIGPCKHYRGRIKSITYSPDGKTLASMGEDETVHLWEVATGKEIRQLGKHTTITIREGSKSLAYSPDGKMLVSMDEVLHLWDTATGKEIRQFRKSFRSCQPWSVTFSPDGKKLAASYQLDQDSEMVVSLWEVATGKRIFWEVGTGKKIDVLASGVRGVNAAEVVFSPDGRLLAAPGKENTVCLWEVATGQRGQLGGIKPGTREGGQFVVRFLAFSPDGRMLATSSEGGDDKIHLWELATGKEIWQLDGLKNNWGCSLAFSPDGRMLAIVAHGATWAGDPYLEVRFWEVASGKEISRRTGHQAEVRTIAFSPDGKTLASGSEDLTCLVWDVTSFWGLLKPAPARPLAPRALSKKQLEAAWADLAQDPAQAYTAARALQAVPTQAIPLLQARVWLVDPADFEQLSRWIADLDSDSFMVRDKAQRRIEKLGGVAFPSLRKALKGRPSVEVRRRLQDLLAGSELFVVSPHRLRELRAVQILEFIGTTEAQQVLQTWAKGIAEAKLTQDAQAALARLAKRSAAKP